VRRATNHGQVPISSTLLFTGNDLGSTVSFDYFDSASFKFNGRIHQAQLKYSK
jgi:hypothetical protein